MSAQVFFQIDGKPLRLADPKGIVHAVEGSEVRKGSMLLWPRCGRGYVPYSAAHLGGSVTCPFCLALEGKPS